MAGSVVAPRAREAWIHATDAARIVLDVSCDLGLGCAFVSLGRREFDFVIRGLSQVRRIAAALGS